MSPNPFRKYVASPAPIMPRNLARRSGARNARYGAPSVARREHVALASAHGPTRLLAAPLLRPRAIAKGDAIGVVTPSYTPRPGWLLRGVKALEHAGFAVILDPEITDSRRFKRVEDERRAENFTGIWLQPSVKAVIAATGGYGAVRIIPHLEPDVFRKNPKSFVGYSDVTALHLWMMRRAGLRTFHGPTVDDLIPSTRDPSMASLIAALTTPRPAAKIGKGIARVVRPGRAEGRLTGGNLSLVQQSIGTPYEVDTRDAILFLEETRDPMSVLDERLVHLRAAGLLKRVKGIVIGQLPIDRSEEDDFENFLLDLFADLDVPILLDFPVGARGAEPHAPHGHDGGARGGGDDGLARLRRGCAGAVGRERGGARAVAREREGFEGAPHAVGERHLGEGGARHADQHLVRSRVQAMRVEVHHVEIDRERRAADLAEVGDHAQPVVQPRGRVELRVHHLPRQPHIVALEDVAEGQPRRRGRSPIPPTR